MLSPHQSSNTSLNEAIAKCKKHTDHPDPKFREDCEKIIKAAERALKNPRRDSRNTGEWCARNGHDARHLLAESVGVSADVVAPAAEIESISDLFLKGKSPDHVREIKRSIARTASRGGHVRTEGLVTAEEIQNEAEQHRASHASVRKEQNPKVY